MYEEIISDSEKMKILSRVIAHLMGDGNVSIRYLRYNNKNQFLLDKFQEDMNILFGDIHFIYGKCNSGTSFVQVQNKNILLFLRSLVSDFRSGSLKFPIFIKSNELKKEFLKAFYDDEGCVALRVFRKTSEIKRNITLCAKSKAFLTEIKNILQRDFLISSNKITECKKVDKIKNKEYYYYVLSISGKENFESFKNKIGFYHPDKIKKLDLMINSYIRK